MSSFSQTIKGKITDKNDIPIPFAKVRVQQSSFGTVANAIGLYQLDLHQKEVILVVSAPGFINQIDTIPLASEVTTRDFKLQENIQEIEEILVVSKTKKERGKEIMKQVIEKRDFFYKQLALFSCETYCFGSLEKQVQDSIIKDSIIGKESLNLVEWRAKSYYKADRSFKDEFIAFNDFSDENFVSFGTNVSVSFDGSMENLAPEASGTSSNPYLFANSFKDVSVNIFENQLSLPDICANPIVSPLAYNAFIYYNFFLEKSFIDTDSSMVYQIQVVPRFKQEALFEGTLYIRDESWELVSYDLGINPASLLFFKEMRLICDYTKLGERLVPTRREFVYYIHERKLDMNGNIKVNHSNYQFEIDDSPKNFWQQSNVFAPDAFDQDTAYWNHNRPFKLREFEERFIKQQDSAINYHESEEYLRKMDSIRNRIGILTIIFGGINHINSFKKHEFGINGLITQVIPFGVGGFRYRLQPYYKKEFKNAMAFSVRPTIDYGFLNQDLKGGFGGSFLYNPLKFSEVSFDFGDEYDFISNYQNIQGTFAPGNRVRNKKMEVGYKTELLNGLYFSTSLFYSDRESIDSLKYPSWNNVFGLFSKPEPFEGYKIFLTTFNFEYHFHQKFMIKKNKKIVMGSPWPVLNLTYKKGIPNLAGTQSNFDFVEFRMRDEIQLNTLGKTDLKFVMGAFLHKKDLRLIEYKFFRTSDRIFFSNPTNSMQLLDTALHTSNNYMQFNFIHHFNGFFLNKIWLINRLKLEETIGGGVLVIPDAKYAQVEFYVGLERRFRIKREIFKLGIYAVTTDNTFDKASIRLKIGFNNYNTYNGTWDY